jgi:hypothetical protein
MISAVPSKQDPRMAITLDEADVLTAIHPFFIAKF